MCADAAQQHGSRRVIFGCFSDSAGELANCLPVDRVAHLRTVEDDLEDGALPPHDYRRHLLGSSHARVYHRAGFAETIPWLSRSCAAVAPSTSGPGQRNSRTFSSRTTRSAKLARPVAKP